MMLWIKAQGGGARSTASRFSLAPLKPLNVSDRVNQNFLIFLFAFVLSTAAPVFALDFEVTPAGAELFRERGSVGYFFWGFYRGC